MLALLLFLLYIILFLIAMRLLRRGLFKLTGEKLNSKLQAVTSTTTKGFFTGMIFTAILQSSSAVMVMTVGLVSVGALSFQQSIGIILGSNIGTTVTAEFMTFSIKNWITPGLFIGFLLMLINKHSLRPIGQSIFGLFLIFFSIQGFTSLAKPLSEYPLFTQIVFQLEQHIFMAIIAGAILTAIIHSSTATIAIAMGFIAGEELSVLAGIALMLGSNIGTCVTGYMASIGAGIDAKLTAYAHIWLNILGVSLFYPFIEQLSVAAAFFTDEKHVQLAHASVIFNLICSIIALPFVKYFNSFIIRLHSNKA